MRKLDDLIVSTINTVIPTDSFHPDGKQACQDLYSQLQDGNQKREKTIKDCISATANKVKKLKEDRESDTDNYKISKSLRFEQTKVCYLLLLCFFAIHASTLYSYACCK